MPLIDDKKRQRALDAMRSGNADLLIRRTGNDTAKEPFIETHSGTNKKGPIRMVDAELMNAIQDNDTQAASKALSAGADINCGGKEHEEYTPLSLAITLGHKAMAAFLIEQGADVHAKGKIKISNSANSSFTIFDATPLMVAASSDDVETGELLLKRGAFVNEQDYWGWTPLMFAARTGASRMAGYLLDNGADAALSTYSIGSKIDSDTLNAQEMAETTGHAETAAIIREKTAKR